MAKNDPAPGSVLVTGGSRGIGAAAARRCAQAGYAVAVNYTRDAGAAERVVADIVAAGGRAIAVQADVADEAQVTALYARLDRELPPLAGLVNNAGVVDLPARVEAMDAARLQRMFAINVFGSFYCAREAVKRMSTKHGGRGGAIVNLSSAAARLGAPGQYVDYAAAKGAIDTFTVGLAKGSRPRASASTRCVPASSRPTSTPAAAFPTASRRWRPSCRCSAPAAPTRWRRRSSGCSRTPRATPPAP
jgi:NAD(P)-dependent dehydrogenase (short-subunit alcohol dehydrogenase family)